MSLFNFQGSFAPFWALQAHPLSKVPDYITTPNPVCQHFFSFFLKIFLNFFVPVFGAQDIGFLCTYDAQFNRQKTKQDNTFLKHRLALHTHKLGGFMIFNFEK